MAELPMHAAATLPQPGESARAARMEKFFVSFRFYTTKTCANAKKVHLSLMVSALVAVLP